MTALAVLLAVAAVLLGLSRPTAGWSRADPVLTSTPHVRSRPPTRAVLVVGSGVGGLLALGVLVDGTRGLVLAVTAALAGGTAARLVVLRLRRRAADRTAQAVVEGCTVLAANLRVGQVPSRALGTAAAACPLLDPAHETLLLGGDVTAVWSRQAEEPGAGGLRELARAWQVADRSGASLGSTLEQVAAGQTADQALRAVVGSELAAPRATGKVMAALPVLGLAMGYLLGGDPVGWLTAGPAGWACTVAGVAFACSGVLWIEALARAASVQG
jgi:tight adherence protein B